MSFSESLKTGADAMGIPLSDDAICRCVAFNDALIQANASMNLTGDLTDSVERHFLDSLSILKYIDFPSGARIADAGTGAGFPGVPLHFAISNCTFTLIDSLNKRLNFIRDALKDDAVTLVHARCEDLGHDTLYRESFDIVLARALAPLNTLLELCLPLTREGGTFCAYKGPGLDQELPQAVVVMRRLGAELIATHHVRIPNTTWDHRIAVFAKVRKTPPQFPRKPGVIGKIPLI